MEEIILNLMRAKLLERTSLDNLPDSIWKKIAVLNTWGTNAIEGSTISRKDADRILLENKTQRTFRLLSPSLEHWIAREISAAPGEEETQASVENWLTSGGRDDLEPISGILPKFKKKYWPVVSGIALDLSLELIGAVTWEVLTKGLF